MKGNRRPFTIIAIAILSTLVVAGFVVAGTLGQPPSRSTPTYRVSSSTPSGTVAGADRTGPGTGVEAGASQDLDPRLPSYSSVSGVAGNLNSVGSDTLNNVLQLMAEDFRAVYPNVNIQIQGAGSSTAPAALRDGTAQLGPMSRAMTGSEIDEFVATYGYGPTQIPIGIDAIGVFVHRENPIESLSVQQLDSIFSNTYRLGGEPISNWGQTGLSGDWATRPISVYGRNSASGTYGVFKNIALGGGDYHPQRYQEQPGSSTVIQSISVDRYGIGYSGIGYLTSGVRVLPIREDDGELFEPTAENAVTGDYPLGRLLYVYINRDPDGELPPLTREFIRFALSREGQTALVRDGFFALPPDIASQTAEMLGIAW